MMKTDLNYCIVLSSEQLAYLAGSKYGIDRMKILHRLIEEAVLKETDYAIKGFSTTLQVGQAVLSEVDLANKLGYDKKTISRVLDKMNQLGIVVSTQSNRTSIHTLKCISAWMQDGNRIDNPFYVRLKDRQNDKEDMPAISDEGKQPSPSSFPSVSLLPLLSLLFPHRLQQRKIPAEIFRLTTRYSRIRKLVCPKLLYAVLQEVPMSHKFASLICTT